MPGLPGLLLLVALAMPAAASAENFWSQFRDAEDGSLDFSRFLSDNAFGFLPVPILITDPAVGGGLGVMGLFFHETDTEREARRKAMQSAEDGSRYLLTPNISALAGAYSGNDSWFAGGGHLGFFRDGRIRYRGGGGYGSVNLDFFGSGTVDLTRPIEINTRAFAIRQSLKFKLGKLPVFAGVSQRLTDARVRPVRLGELEGDILPPGLREKWQDLVRNLLNRDVRTSALGVLVELDTRDNYFSPHSGFFYTLEQSWFRSALGSDIDYELTRFDALNYLRLSKKLRLAIRVDIEHAHTDSLLPPYATPAIRLRGIPAGRFQGTTAAVVEGELTWQINRRWSLNGFAGAGRASNSSAELNDVNSRVTRGGGFRYLIASRYGFEMGLDIARGPEDTIFYIQAGSAW